MIETIALSVLCTLIFVGWVYTGFANKAYEKRRAERQAEWARQDARWDARQELKAAREARVPLAERIRSI